MKVLGGSLVSVDSHTRTIKAGEHRHTHRDTHRDIHRHIHRDIDTTYTETALSAQAQTRTQTQKHTQAQPHTANTHARVQAHKSAHTHRHTHGDRRTETDAGTPSPIAHAPTLTPAHTPCDGRGGTYAGIACRWRPGSAECPQGLRPLRRQRCGVWVWWPCPGGQPDQGVGTRCAFLGVRCCGPLHGSGPGPRLAPAA